MQVETIVTRLLHPAFPVQEDADEARLEEEGGQCLHADHRPQDRADGPGVITPVEAELEGQHDAGHDPEPEADGEDLRQNRNI